MNKLGLISSIALMTISMGVSAQARDPASMTIDCELADQGTFEISTGKQIVHDDRQRPMAITFGGLDDVNGKALLLGNAGAVPVLFEANEFRFVFVQLTDTGNATVTSMPIPSAAGETYAVHSRHIWILGEGVISQWSGPCRLRN